MATPELKVKITLDSSGFHTKMVKAHKDTQTLGEGFSKLKEQLAALFAIREGFEFLKSSAEAFMGLEKAANNLKQSLSMRGGLASDFVILNEQFEKLSSKTIFKTEQLDNAAAMGASFGMSAQQISKIMPLLADLASRRGMSLDEAMGLTEQSLLGKTRGLQKLGLDLTKTKHSFNDISEELQKIYGGSAEGDVLNTAAGNIQNLSNEWEKFKEGVGQGVMEVFKELRPEIVKLLDYLKSNLPNIKREFKSIGEDILIVINFIKDNWRGIKSTILAITAATIGWKIAQIELNVVMAANPLGAVLTALGLFLGLLYKLKLAEDELAGILQDQKDYAYNLLIKDFEKRKKLLMDEGKLKEDAAAIEALRVEKSISLEQYRMAKFAEFKMARKLGYNDKELGDLYEKATPKAKAALLAGETPEMQELRKSSERALSAYQKLSSFQTQKDLTELTNKISGNAKDSGLQTPETFSGGRPQNLYITIDKLIETQNINSTNLTDSKDKIKEQVAEALLEAVNDLNQVNKQ